MNFQKIKVYHLLWIVALLILIIGLIDPDNTLDINIHDTYFVILNLHVAIALFLFYFLNGLGYWSIQKILKKRLIKPLTIIHTTILIGSFVFYWLIIIYSKMFLSNSTFPLFDDGRDLINITLVLELLLILFLATPIFIINLLIGLLRRTNNNKI